MAVCAAVPHQDRCSHESWGIRWDLRQILVVHICQDQRRWWTARDGACLRPAESQALGLRNDGRDRRRGILQNHCMGSQGTLDPEWQVRQSSVVRVLVLFQRSCEYRDLGASLPLSLPFSGACLLLFAWINKTIESVGLAMLSSSRTIL